MREPLVPPLAAIATGIVVSRLVAFGTEELLLACAVLFLLGIFAVWRKARLAAGCCALTGLLFASVLADVAHRPGPRPELDAEGPVILAGCVVEPPVLAGDRQRFVLELEPGARAQVSLYGEERGPDLAYGQQIELDARVRRPHNFLNPGAFDYVRYLARRDVYWTASARPSGVRVLPGRCGSRFVEAVTHLRTAALERIAQLYGGRPYETGMMQAILIGETYQLERVWTENFRSTGTFHALVISGTHVAVLAAFLMFVLRLLLVPRGAAACVTVLAAWLYALVTGWQAPCVRSAAGFTLFLIGRFFYRRQSGVNLLAAVAIGFLVLDPEQLFEPSFQLSFLAVAFIVLFAAPLLERTTAPLARGMGGLRDTGRDRHLEPRVAQFRVEMRLIIETLRLYTRIPARSLAPAVAATVRSLCYVFELAVVSAAGQLGLILPMVMYFHRVGFSGLTANLLVVPLMGLVVPVGFVAIFTGWRWVASLAAVLLALSERVVRWHAAVEPRWFIPTPPVWLAIAVAAALTLAALANRSAVRWRALAALPLACVLALLVWHPFPPQVVRGQFEATAIDVGQGDSLLLAFPDGRLMAMDGGGIPTFGHRTARLEIGADVVSPYLWHRSIRRLDTVVMSHAHEDHAGGLAALIENFRPRELWAGPVPETPLWCKLRETARRAGTRLVTLRAGSTFDYGGARIEVLAPAADYQPADRVRDDDSLALRITWGRHSFLFTGDMQPFVEAGLSSGDLRADVLKVAHHGSRRSTTPYFLDAVRPGFALISVGIDNTYGHPHPDVLERLRERGTAVLRTDRLGQITVRSDGRRLTVDTALWSGAPGMLYRPF